jgi:hypothetical protein
MQKGCSSVHEDFETGAQASGAKVHINMVDKKIVVEITYGVEYRQRHNRETTDYHPASNYTAGESFTRKRGRRPIVRSVLAQWLSTNHSKADALLGFKV